MDKQVADSAGTATAYLTGVKGRYGTLGLDVSAPYNVCRSDLGTKANVDSVIKWAQDAGKATGKLRLQTRPVLNLNCNLQLRFRNDDQSNTCYSGGTICSYSQS